jgi:sugar lactone lactonase YvrE
MNAIEVVQREQALVGEGPVWLPQERALYWLDIKGLKIFRCDAATGTSQSWPTPERIGALIPSNQGGFIALAKSGVYATGPAFTRFDKLAAPDADKPGNRFNDAKCDPKGRLWAGTMDDDEHEASGRLYRFDSRTTSVRVRDNVNLSNGLGWSPDGTKMYFVETLRRTIWLFDYDLSDGTATNARAFVEIPEGDGYPDGMCVDAEGCIWLAHWGGWRLTRFTPDGHIDRVVPMPVPQLTSCAFGGPNLDTLYITSAAIGLDAETKAKAPLSGCLFAFDPGVQGLPVAAFCD